MSAHTRIWKPCLASLAGLIVTAHAGLARAQSPLPASQPAAGRVTLSDNFKTDSRSDYIVSGTVAWQAGEVMLASGGSMARRIRAGSPFELNLTLEFLPGDDAAVENDCSLVLNNGDAVRVNLRQREEAGRRVAHIRIYTGHREGKKFVSRLVRQAVVDGVLKAGTWQIRYRHGLVRVAGPGQPAVYAYFSPEFWITALITVQRSGKMRCRGLHVSATAPPAPLTPKQIETLNAAGKELSEADRLSQANDFAGALAAAQRALEICEKTVGTGHLLTIKARAILGSHHASTQDPRSRTCLEAALAAARDLYGEEHPETAKLLQYVGRTRRRFRDHVGALALFGKALDIFHRCVGEESKQAAEVLCDMGDALFRQHEHAAANDHYTRALRILSKVLDREDPKIAELHVALGRLATARAEYDAAAAAFEKARRIYEKAAGTDSLEMAELLEQRGSLERARGKYAAASDDYRKALDIQERRAGKDDRHTAFVLASLGDLLIDQGDDQEAERCHRKALTIFEKVYGKDHPVVATAFNQLGSIEVGRDHFTAARDHFESVLRILRKVSADVLPGLSEAEGLEYVEQMYGFRDILLSDLRAIPGLAAVDAYRAVWQTRAVVSQTVELRVRASLTDPAARSLLEQFRATRRELAALTLAAVPADMRAARQQKLAELAEKKEEQERELGRRSEAFHQLSQARKADLADLGRLLPRDVAVVEFFMTADFFNKRRPVYDAFVLRHAEARPGYTVGWARLGDAGPIDEAVMQWRKQLTGGDQERAGTRAVAPAPAPKVPPDRRLRELVWDKLEPHLAGCATVLIIPDSALARVPWTALPGRKEGSYLLEEYAVATASHGQHLYRLLASEPRRGAGNDRLLLVGGVDYDADKANVAAAPAGEWPRGPELDPQQRPRWRELPGTRQEIEDVAERWGRRKDLVYLEGREATEAAVRTHLPDTRYIHLATHGFFADKRFRSAFQHDLQREGLGPVALPGVQRATIAGRNPLVLSGVVVAGANVPPPADEFGAPVGDDGILTAEELAETDLSAAELVVLSACETGLGDVAGGEGVFGLQRAIHQAGARTVIASLWKVHDGATRALMVRFYDNLWRKKMSKLEALREAQRWMLREVGRLADLPRGLEFVRERRDQNRRLPPVYWAALVLDGDWR
jgi:CHAT domain-containing protein/tetratricopeptide (TPR) repeat protein